MDYAKHTSMKNAGKEELHKEYKKLLEILYVLIKLNLYVIQDCQAKRISTTLDL